MGRWFLLGLVIFNCHYRLLLFTLLNKLICYFGHLSYLLLLLLRLWWSLWRDLAGVIIALFLVALRWWSMILIVLLWLRIICLRMQVLHKVIHDINISKFRLLLVSLFLVHLRVAYAILFVTTKNGTFNWCLILQVTAFQECHWILFIVSFTLLLLILTFLLSSCSWVMHSSSTFSPSLILLMLSRDVIARYYSSYLLLLLLLLTSLQMNSKSLSLVLSSLGAFSLRRFSSTVWICFKLRFVNFCRIRLH